MEPDEEVIAIWPTYRSDDQSIREDLVPMLVALSSALWARFGGGLMADMARLNYPRFARLDLDASEPFSPTRRAQVDELITFFVSIVRPDVLISRFGWSPPTWRPMRDGFNDTNNVRAHFHHYGSVALLGALAGMFNFSLAELTRDGLDKGSMAAKLNHHNLGSERSLKWRAALQSPDVPWTAE